MLTFQIIALFALTAAHIPHVSASDSKKLFGLVVDTLKESCAAPPVPGSVSVDCKYININNEFGKVCLLQKASMQKGRRLRTANVVKREDTQAEMMSMLNSAEGHMMVAKAVIGGGGSRLLQMSASSLSSNSIMQGTKQTSHPIAVQATRPVSPFTAFLQKVRDVIANKAVLELFSRSLTDTKYRVTVFYSRRQSGCM